MYPIVKYELINLQPCNITPHVHLIVSPYMLEYTDTEYVT